MFEWFPELQAFVLAWARPATAAVVAIFVALVLFRVGDRLLRRAAATSPAAQEVLSRAFRPASVLAPLIGLQASLHGAADTVPGIEAARHLAWVLLIAVGAWLGARCMAGIERAVAVRRPLAGTDNLAARRLQTQMRVLTRVTQGTLTLVAAALILMTFPAVRQVGASLLASAGVAGIVAGLAARPVLGNLIAGLQIGLTQPIRLDDVVIVEGEWGVIEEITGNYVVVRIWDERRLVVPLQWWIDHPFQNWTRRTTHLLGTVFLWVDYALPLEPLRAELRRACEGTALWDGRVCLLQVTEAGERAMQLRALVSAADAGRAWDLRCLVRERLLDFITRQYPHCLPTLRMSASAPGTEAKQPVPGADRPDEQVLARSAS